MAISENAKSIIEALDLLGVSDETATTNAVVPTAHTRQAIELLTYSTLEDLKDLNFKKITDNLYNWADTPRSTKTLTHAVIEALRTPNKYQTAITAIAYTTALSPLLEPDRLIRVLNAALKVDSVFAPMKYTLQLSTKLKEAFESFPQERIEKLAISLWEIAHQGRWWNVEYGITEEAPQTETPQNFENKTEKELTEHVINTIGTYDPHNIPALKTVPYSHEILQVAQDYQKKIFNGELVDPDTAINLSLIPWLPLENRPDNPIMSLLSSAIRIKNQNPHLTPTKPRTFSELFPIEYLTAATSQYPLIPSLVKATTITNENITIRPITSTLQLKENAQYMGNCTASYNQRLADGKAILLFITYKDTAFNAYITGQSGEWVIGEVNSRFNSGQKHGIAEQVKNIVTKLPPMNNKTLAEIENFKERTDAMKRIHRSQEIFKYA